MQKILIIKLSSLGDVVHALPVLSGLKQSLPDAQISWMVSRAFSSLLEGHPDLDQIILFERERWRGVKNCILRFPEIWRLVQDIRAFQFDVVLDLQGLLRSGLFTWLAHAPERFGFTDARECSYLAYNHKVVVPTWITHAVDKNLFLAEQYVGHNLTLHFKIALSAKDQEKAKLWIPNLPAVVLVPGARWASKCWPTLHFAQLIDFLLQKQNISVVLVGAKSDLGIGEEIIRQAWLGQKVINLIGKTSLKELAAVMQRANLVVSNDSGPMHIAAAMGTKVVALFGPTQTNKTGPYGDGHIVLQ